MPLSAAASAREILTGLHDIMGARGSAQSKLDKVVDLIAEAMGSEVCSIYLLRDNYLELFATHGLRKEAVHVTRLKMGEGLVGTIAAEGRILNLDEAAEHPAFAYRPETGEERFHSFAGVPIVRLESPMGVLAVQHADPRRYEDVEIEALQTVAMVLSEMIAAARLVDGARRSRLRSAGRSGSPASSSSPAWRRATRYSTSRASLSSTRSPTTSRPSASASTRPFARCASRSTIWRRRPSSAPPAS